MAKPQIPPQGRGQGQHEKQGAGVPPGAVPLEAPVSLPTYLMYSEAVTLLVEKGGLRVSEARLVVGKIRQAPTKGEFRKWHYKDVLAKAEALRNDPEARA
jgi:hypothetical protein